MSKKQNVAAALKLIQERAASDDKLLKDLDYLDDARLSDTDGSAREADRSRLPYSSPPPLIDPVWK